MGTGDRSRHRELRSWITANAHRYTFFKLLSDLEAEGWSGPEKLSIAPLAARVFPSRDIHDMRFTDQPYGEKAEITAWFDGLYGVDSPLPGYFDDLIEGDDDLGSNLKALLSLVGNRFYHLRYEIWKRLTPIHADEDSLLDCVRKPVLCLSGLSHLKNANVNMLGASPFLNQGMRNRWGLEKLLTTFLGLTVKVREFDRSRIPLSENEKTRLGDEETAVLGRSFRANPYRETLASHVRITCGPLKLDQYISLLPGGERHKLLAYLTSRYLPVDIEYNLELILDGRQASRLGFSLTRGKERLGATTMLRRGDCDRDLHIHRVGVSLSCQPETLQAIMADLDGDRSGRQTA